MGSIMTDASSEDQTTRPDMSESPPVAPAPASEPPEDVDTDTDAGSRGPIVDSHFSQSQVEQAIAMSLESIPPLMMDEVSRRSDLREVKRIHDADLFKTQDNYRDDGVNNGNVLVFVKFPESRSTTSCRFTSFDTGRVRLTYEEVLSTGSELLEGLLKNERHQRRAKKAAAPLPEGIEYVLDLSPTTDENDYTIALQLLSTPRAVQLWYRSMAIGSSPLAVAGHDDVCTCLTPIDEPYLFPTPPEAIKSQDGNVCILDTKQWPVEYDRKIDDFCTTRWAANTLRLFRAISLPPGRKDLVIDSAPRLWTLVGLFAKLEMTNYDILRDEVVAWFNADMNHAFVELCPEEALHIGLILKTPLLTEPAFRILVNERALEVAGGQPRSQPTTTLFGRRCSDFTGTDVAESISRMIEHASCAMTERYKLALDGLCGDNALDILDSPEWQELRSLDHVIPKDSDDINTCHIRETYDEMMDLIRQMFRESVDRILQGQCKNLPFRFADAIRHDHFSLHGITIDKIEGKRAFSVPKEELLTTQAFPTVFNSLNWLQRALTPIIWHELSALANNPQALVNREKVMTTVIAFKAMLSEAGHGDELFGRELLKLRGVLKHGSCKILFQSILRKLKAYVTPLIYRDENSFVYTMTPHLLLSLNDHEMNFLRLADDESTFQTEAPETDLGPNGPGPAFHTGQTVPSVSDLDFEKLAVESTDGVSTMGRSMAAQDGVSTVYNRKRVLARSMTPSVASEQFTDGDSASADYMEAEYKVPADHQSRGHTLAQIVEQMDDEDDLDSLDFDLDEDSDSDTVMGDDDVADVGSDQVDHVVDHPNVQMASTTSDPDIQENEDEATWSEDFDDSDFEVIKKDETMSNER